MDKVYYKVTSRPPASLLRTLRSLVKDSNTDLLLSLTKDELIALLSGILDGDGYIGKGYISVSYKRDSVKGKIVDSILKIMHMKGLIFLYSYRDYPHYERIIRLTYPALNKLISLVFVPYKSLRLKNIVSNVKRYVECGLDIDSLTKLLCNSRSLYIDWRKTGNRILVLYIDESFCNALVLDSVYLGLSIIKRRDKRCMIKIGTKCVDLLRTILEKGLLKDCPPNKLTVVKKFIGNTKAY